MSTVSPLLEVERAVQERAKEVALDMATPEGAARLRALVDEEVARWSQDYKRGLRSIDIADAAAVAERAFRNVAGYGPLQPLLADDDVWEIMVNGPDAIFVKRHKGPSGYHDEVFHDDDHVVRTLTKILDDATGSHRKLDPAEGLQDAQLDTGARIHIVHGDVGRDGHLLVNIRKFTGVRFSLTYPPPRAVPPGPAPRYSPRYVVSQRRLDSLRRTARHRRRTSRRFPVGEPARVCPGEGQDRTA